MGEVTVEFYGIPRQRAGRSQLAVAASTLREALRGVERICPALGPLTEPDGRLTPHYLVSLEGQRFLADPDQALRPGDRLLLLSADAGG
jgi:molybdopterin converting factor small subunit